MNPGERYGAYELLELLGRGGMGEVWKARDVDLGRCVALKFIREFDSESLARFRREARIVARLSHPNMAALYEIGEDDAHPYIVMQFVDGVSLDEAPLTVDAKVRALAQAARAVQHAHEAGVLHRDLKPANIMAAADGRAVVLDFGLAREIRKGPGGTIGTLSLEGDILGTPAYMSPEQARGETAALTASADVFGLGATLYGLLVGHGPFAAENAYEALDRALRFDPPPPSGDPDLVTVCMKALEKDPARRYATAADVADDLERWLRGDPILARRSGLAYRLAKRIRRRPLLWALGAATALAVLVAGGFVVAQEIKRRDSLLRKGENLDQQSAALAERGRALDREMTTLAFLERVRRWSDDIDRLDRALARRISDTEVDRVRADLAAVEADLTAEITVRPHEGVPFLLRGRARRLLGDDDAAAADFDAAVAGSDSDLSRASSVETRARFERVRLNIDRMVDAVSLVVAFRSEKDLKALTDHFKARIREDLRHIERRDLPAAEAELLAVSDLMFRTSEERVDAATAVIERGGAAPEFYAARAEARELLSKDYAGAVADIDEALSIHAGRPRFHLIRAYALERLGRPVEAEKAYDRALKLAPRNAAALCNRGALLGKSGRFEAAERDIRLALERADDVPQIWLNLAMILRFTGRPEESLDAFERLVKLAPGYPVAYDERSKLLLDLGRLQSSLADLNHAIELEENYMEARLDRGVVLIELGRFADALSDLDVAVDLDEDCPEAWATRGAALRHLNRLDDAVASYDRALALRPNYAKARANRGLCHDLNGDLRRALEDLDAALDQDPAFFIACNWRGIVHAKRGDNEKAVADFTAFLRARPDPNVLWNRARSYATLARWPEAATDLRAALKLLPEGDSRRPSIESALKDAERRSGSDF